MGSNKDEKQKITNRTIIHQLKYRFILHIREAAYFPQEPTKNLNHLNQKFKNLNPNSASIGSKNMFNLVMIESSGFYVLVDGNYTYLKI